MKRDKSIYIKTKRLCLYPLSDEDIKKLIDNTKDLDVKEAYKEMLKGCTGYPDERVWYAPWAMELKGEKKRIGYLSFKGPEKENAVEFGYGIDKEYEGKGYTTEASKALVEWAFSNEAVLFVEAEASEENPASIRILEKLEFSRGLRGSEGQRFVKEKPAMAYTSIGLCLGLCFGLSMGNLLFDNMSIGMCIGLAIGLCFGSAFDAKEKKKMSDAKKKRGTVLEKNTLVRLEKEEEHREVETLVRNSFWNVYRPGCMEHFVLKELRNDPDFVKELDFVMLKDGKIIGQNIFVRTKLKIDMGRDLNIMTMGPICITPELKRKGYGKILLDYSLEKAKELGCGAVCFEGNIDFYGKSGFKYAAEYGIRYHGLPEGEDSSFFLCKELISGYLKGKTGEYETPSGYLVCERKPEEFEKYEASFPYKKKEKLPGQMFSE